MASKKKEITMPLHSFSLNPSDSNRSDLIIQSWIERLINIGSTLFQSQLNLVDRSWYQHFLDKKLVSTFFQRQLNLVDRSW